LLFLAPDVISNDDVDILLYDSYFWIPVLYHKWAATGEIKKAF
jgi:hypothetical protein